MHTRIGRNPVPLLGPASFYRTALAIAIPVMLQSLITGLVSLVDNFMVADLGDVKMAAVNAANQVNFVFFIVINTACTAGGIYLAQHRGAGDREGMRQAFRFKILAGLVLSGAYFLVCILFPESLLRFMVGGNSSGESIIAQGAVYMRTVAPSFIPWALAIAFGSSYRETGMTRVPLVASTIAALVNTFLNWVFIYGNLGSPRMEVAGAAIATNIARYVEIGLFILWTVRKKPAFSFHVRSLFALDGKLLRAILSRSGMMLFSETAWVVSETIITAMYNSRGGAETVAGMAAAWTIANLFFLVFGAVHTATAVTVGTSLGAGKLDEARAQARWIMSGSVLFGAAVGAVAALSTALIPVVFGNLSGAAQATTRAMVFVIACYLPLWTRLNAQFAVSRAGGDTAMGVWVDVGITYAIFIPVAWALSALTPVGPVALFGWSKLTDFAKTGIAAWWLDKEVWVRNLAARKPEAGQP